MPLLECTVLDSSGKRWTKVAFVNRILQCKFFPSFSDKPKIVTANGNIAIQSAANHNISLLTDDKGDINLGATSVKTLLNTVYFLFYFTLPGSDVVSNMRPKVWTCPSRLGQVHQKYEVNNQLITKKVPEGNKIFLGHLVHCHCLVSVFN